MHVSYGVAGERERRREPPVWGEITGVERDRLSEQTDGAGPLARLDEGGGAFAENAQRSRAVFLFEMHLREAAITALGARELVDQVLEALLGLTQSPLLEALETFFESDLVVEVLRRHDPSLRSERAFGLALRELRRLSGALETRLLPLLGARVARQQTGLAQQRKVLAVHLEERARDAVRDRADLAAHAATFHLDHRVEAARGAGDGERQQGLVGRAVAGEVVVERLSVYDDGAFTGYEPDASLRRVHDDDRVPGVEVRREDRLVLSAEDRGHFGREAPQYDAVRVDDAPAPCDLTLLRCVRLHFLLIRLVKLSFVFCLTVFDRDQAQPVRRCARTRQCSVVAINDPLER